MRTGLLLIGGGIAAIALAAHKQIGDAVASFDTSKQAVRNALRNAAASYGLDPDWVDAIGKTESGWKVGALNAEGPDAARGGAFGPTQITEETARAFGYEGDMNALRADPALAADWTCRIIAAGHCQSFEDLCAWWNGGVPKMASVDPTSKKGQKLAVYASNALDSLIYVQNHPPEA
jgi:hypothetical protein